MVKTKRSKWMLRGVMALGAGLLILIIVATWSYSGVLRDELVAVNPENLVEEVEVVTVGSGRIVVARTATTAAEGIWGVVGPNGYGQASVLIGQTDETVERAFRTIEGSFDVGQQVSFDLVAYPGDPFEAHGIQFDEVRFTGDLGVYPAWVIDGDRDPWIVIVHGSGPAGRAEALRVLPGLVGERYPVMVTTVRSDVGAPPSRTGLRALGATEWRDLEAAIEFGLSQRAEEFVLIGLDTGASTVAMYLHEADDITHIKGVVFDSALHDPEQIADELAADRNVPAPMRWAGKLLASIRFDIDWSELDQIRRAPEYTVPVLVMHGAADGVAPVVLAEAFVANLGSLATYEEFAAGMHSQLWNADPARYDRALVRFIDRVRTAE